MFIVAIFYRLQLFFFAFAIAAAGLVGAGMVSGMSQDSAAQQKAQGVSQRAGRADEALPTR